MSCLSCLHFCASTHEDCVWQTIQEPFPTSDENGIAWTLRDLLLWLLPDVFADCSEEGMDDRISIQGIQPPLTTPVQWLARHMAHPDNFVHLVLHLA